jgi:hypothetical protein
MLGTLDGRYPPGTINRLVEDMNKAVPMRTELILPNNGLVCELIGKGFIIYLIHRPSEVEPWCSRELTCQLERLDPDLDDIALAGRLYDALVETGRYRVLVE